MLPRRSLIAAAGALPLLNAFGQTQGVPAKNSVLSLDVLVIGSGIAGLSAAVSAKQNGAERVAVFEKQNLVGGHSAVSTGYMAAAHRGKSEKNYRRAVERFIADINRVGKNQGDQTLIRTLAENSGEAVDWIASMGVVWMGDTYEALGGLTPRSFLSGFVRGGYDIVFALRKAALSLGVDLFFESGVRDIRPLPEGGYGVLVQGRTDSFVVLAKTVVIATGGFGDNEAMRVRFDPRLTGEFTSTANPYREGRNTATGDGILLGMALGADTVDMEHILTIPFSGGRLTNYVGPDVYLTRGGRRFVNEAASMQEISDAVWKLPEKSFWVITDAQSTKGASRNVKLIKGIVRIAHSVEEMADGMDVPVNVLKRTLAEYNHFAATGVDPEFGRTTFTQEIKVPPFYYGIERPFIHFCNGGLRFDKRARVLKANREAIPGLFVAGEAAGGVHGAGRLGGCSVTECVVFGKIAGREAAAMTKKSTRL